jgi:hypothetical protein
MPEPIQHVRGMTSVQRINPDRWKLRWHNGRLVQGVLIPGDVLYVDAAVVGRVDLEDVSPSKPEPGVRQVA